MPPPPLFSKFLEPTLPFMIDHITNQDNTQLFCPCTGYFHIYQCLNSSDLLTEWWTPPPPSFAKNLYNNVSKTTKWEVSGLSPNT
jgi:hypothetical protein